MTTTLTATLTATDLFSGGGGLSLGLERAGFHVPIAANHWPTAVDTYRRNHADTEVRIANLSEVDWRSFPRTDLLAAAPSCVWHARAGGRSKPPAEVERLRADAGAIDRATAFAVIAAAEVHTYRTILVENVPEFRDWSLFRWWLDGLAALGYTTHERVLDAADYGHAQHRRRLFIIATRDGLDLDLTPPEVAPVYASAILDDDPGKEVTRRLYVAEQIEQVQQAQEDGVAHLVTYRRNARARRADSHRLATVTAGGNHHGVVTVRDGVTCHRMLTNRECARAQGFGDDYEFSGNRAEVKRQIGNAVAVGVAAWLGSRIAAAMGHDLRLAA